MKRIIWMFYLCLFSISCKNDTNSTHMPVSIDNVLGEWGVVLTTRNNRVANSLTNAKFIITDSTFSCNFLDNSSSFPYSFDGKVLKVINPSENVYSVRLMTQDTLLLAAEIKNFDFKFTAVKKSTK